MNSKNAKRLKTLDAIPGIEVEAVTPLAALERARLAWKNIGSSATLEIDVNIYGPWSLGRAVAEKLSAVKLFLQPPAFELRRLPYDNPQYLKLPDVSKAEVFYEDISGSRSSPKVVIKEVSISDVEAILDYLPQPKFLREVMIDGRISTSLVGYVCKKINIVNVSQSFSHQKEAVDFITRRESGDLPPSLSLWKPQVSDQNLFL